MNLSERIKRRMRELELSAADLSRAVGVKPSSMSLWLNGTTKSIKGSNLLKAAKALKVDAEWLATGKGSAQSHSVQEPLAQYVLTKSEDPELEEAFDLLRSMGRPERLEALSFLRVFAAKKGGAASTHSANLSLSRSRKKAA